MISQLSYHKRGRDVKIERFPSTPTRAAFTTLHEERLASALAAAKATVRASVMAEAAVAAAKAADAAKAAEVALEKAEADLAAAEAAEATARAAEAALAVCVGQLEKEPLLLVRLPCRPQSTFSERHLEPEVLLQVSRVGPGSVYRRGPGILIGD
jgi:hypothetical protein